MGYNILVLLLFLICFHFYSRNNIENIEQVSFLNMCQNLEQLTLEGNPICVTPSPDETSVSGLTVYLSYDILHVQTHILLHCSHYCHKLSKKYGTQYKL